jgi:hypothetical protein
LELRGEHESHLATASSTLRRPSKALKLIFVEN